MEVAPIRVFLRDFFLSQGHYHPWENVEKMAIISKEVLAKFGYTSHMK
jgi:hypothetical protein